VTPDQVAPEVAPDQAEDSSVRVRIRGRELSLAMTEEQVDRLKALAERILHEPFTMRVWSELAFFLLGSALAGVGLFFVWVTGLAGLVLAITFFGLALLAFSLRIGRGIGGLERNLVRSMLGEPVEDPPPFAGRPGFLGWLQSCLRDRVAWRAVGYLALKVPWSILGIFVAISVWWDAFACLTHPLFGANGGGPGLWGPVRVFSPGGDFQGFNSQSFIHEVAIFIFGGVLFFAAPWVMRGFVNVDRLLIRSLLGPDPMATRVRSLEQARTQTVDASAATLRRIERDLHDGTQAQLVALAMRLGMAKEKLEDDPAHVDLDRVRELVDAAHRGAKEAIAELRDIARGIHPPALDIGLEGALATLAARSAVPTELSVELRTRPTPAIEAIAYFCVAELLANVAQHARASRATVSCAQQGSWLRLVVRDDGTGGAKLTSVGSSSSGLAGLTDRVHTVDGQLYLVSPPGGPTVVTVDLPLAT
jgi:signal transduction histidine kinase